MPGYDDILNLLVLYDTARGYLSLNETREIIHHGLLSFSGAAGSRQALFLLLDPDDSLQLLSPRGEAAPATGPVRLAPATRELLAGDPGPLHADQLGRDYPGLADLARRFELSLIVPVTDGRTLHGLAGLGERRLGETYTETQLSLIHEIASLTATALGRLKAGAGEKTTRGRDEPSLEELRRAHPPLARIAGRSPGIRAVVEEILTLADFDLPVLITGETGTGKELVARALHEIGPRAAGPFVAVNCAAIPRDLVSSHLFGHEKGSFTGAIADARGAFERAGEGTLFLDEIGDMPLDVQASLLRVLQERRFSRVGGERLLPANARILSATNRNLEEAVAAGTFRADLFYRIQMYSLRLQPLRERREDIPLIVEHILNEVRGVRGQAPRASARFVAALESLPLRGNVRELEGLVLSAVVRARGGDSLEVDHLMPSLLSAREGAAASSGRAEPPLLDPPSPAPPASGPRDDDAPAVVPYEEMEREYIRSVLRVTDGNKKQAAALMRIPRTTLADRMKKLGLEG